MTATLPEFRAEIPLRIEFRRETAERLGGFAGLAREELSAAGLGMQPVVRDQHLAA
jgi:hypothetical protein